jgi:5-methylcytosine-specific restriction endonuclease McrA
MDNDIKQIKIEEPIKNYKTKTKTKTILCQKERKMRVETQFWGLNDEELSHNKQLNILTDSHFIQNENKNTYISKLLSHIKHKISGYRHQDVLKKKFNDGEFVSFEETVNLLKLSNLKCCYCSENIYILYEHVREMKQWSLDRIDNNMGHNMGNLVVACLECNLKRRRTNKDAFMFTKNMVIIKEGQ